MRRFYRTGLACLLSFLLFIAGCGTGSADSGAVSGITGTAAAESDARILSERVALSAEEAAGADDPAEPAGSDARILPEGVALSAEEAAETDDPEEPAYSVRDYSGEPYEVINDNVPFFESYEMITDPFEYYSDLDDLGRCGEAYANICRELMPTDDRESISSVTPSGWNNNPYDFIDGGYLYNRCHLIAFQLAGENANELNLITGTRYFNVTGMLPFENMVSDYVQETDNHVLYRVTPVYEGDNLVADGVLMEAYSVEDSGAGVAFCVFVFNVQPGVTIDYATGENWSDGTTEASAGAETDAEETGAEETDARGADAADTDVTGHYVLNTNTMRFHYPDCDSVNQMKEKNKQDYTGSRQALLDAGYVPCGSCLP